MKDQKYQIGDKVKIVDRPIRMTYAWVDDMNACCGMEVTINEIRWDNGHHCWYYRFREIPFYWDDTCFSPVVQEEEADFTIENDEFVHLIFG